jgi:hypothetical protein
MMALIAAATAAAVTAAAPSPPTFTKTYLDKTELQVQLIGEASDVLRVTVRPPGSGGTRSNAYRDFIESAAPSRTAGLAARKNAAGDTVLSAAAGSFELTVGATAPTTALAISGVVVSRELRGVTTVRGAECLPPGWSELDRVSGSSAGTMAATLTGTATDDACLRMARSLAAGEQLYGFGQVPQEGLSAVGDAKLLATSSRNQLDGPSHAPAPFYCSVQPAPGGGVVSHGVLLNTGGYSMWDLGNASVEEVRIHSPDKIMDVFLFVGPAPRDVVAQMTSISGRRRSLRSGRWASSITPATACPRRSLRQPWPTFRRTRHRSPTWSSRTITTPVKTWPLKLSLTRRRW